MAFRLNKPEITRWLVLGGCILGIVYFAVSLAVWGIMGVVIWTRKKIGVDWLMFLHAIPAVVLLCTSIAASILAARKKVRRAAVTLGLVLVASVYGFYFDTTNHLYQVGPDYYFTWWWYSKLDKPEKRRTIHVNYKYGYIDKAGAIVIEPQFDRADRFSDGMARIAIRSKVDKVGEDVVPSKPDFPDGPPGKRQPYYTKYGYIDKTGQIVITPQFDSSAGHFSDGMARIRINGKYGYINKTGKIAVKPEFNYMAKRFSEGMASVVVGGRYGFIDKTGQIVVKPQFVRAANFSEGLAAVKIDNKHGYINTTGRTVIRPRFDYTCSFHEGLAAVRINNKWGFINRTGRIVIEPQFDGAFTFREGLAPIRVDDRWSFIENWGYIDKTGRVVIEPKFTFPGHFCEGLAYVGYLRGWGYRRKYKWELIDRTGIPVNRPYFDKAGHFFIEGLTPVLIDNKYGYLDKTGRIVIEPQFDYAGLFSGGLACVGIKVSG